MRGARKGSMAGTSDEKQRVARLASDFEAAASMGSWSVEGGNVFLRRGVSAGDDCAVVDLHGDLSLVFGSDYVRGPKFALFERGLLDHYDLGYYLVAANISDIAAMGAQPVGVLTVVRYPPDLDDEDFAAVMRGARDAATAFGCDIVGGDTGSAERLILSASAFGICAKGAALTRDGAGDGDVLFVTGELGTPAAAVAYLGDGADPRKLPETVLTELLRPWRRPEPRVPQGCWLSSERIASSCQDISDGLRATLSELSKSSDVGFVVNEEAVPVSRSVQHVAEALALDPLALALSASVDFELAFTVPATRADRCRGEFATRGWPLFEIGRVVDAPGIWLARPDGSRVDLPGMEWRHQEGDIASLLRQGSSDAGPGGD